jgi:hypothetical protein
MLAQPLTPKAIALAMIAVRDFIEDDLRRTVIGQRRRGPGQPTKIYIVSVGAGIGAALISP